MKKNTAKKIVGGLGFFVLLLSLFIKAITPAFSNSNQTEDTVNLGDVVYEDCDDIHHF